MRTVVDHHLHSYLSRAVSKHMNLEVIDAACRQKGIDIVGTGDFTHPVWFKELKAKLIPAEDGLFCLKDNPSSTRFLLSCEISSIYSKQGRLRKVHNVVVFPSLNDVESFNKKLSIIGNLHADGRPTLGLGSKELLEITLEVNPLSLFIPAHAWTPWFSVFGSNSGFDSLEECFEDLTHYVYAIETGLSSDPAMNWRLSKLDSVALVSSSDAHSPHKLAREATIFNCPRSYKSIFNILKNREHHNIETIEFFPQEGKYHYDGHRNCNISFTPDQTKKHNFTCPVCKRKLTVGVLHRIESLADRPNGYSPKNPMKFQSVIPLEELLADIRSVGVSSKKVQLEYQQLLSNGFTELQILLELDKEKLQRFCAEEIVEAIMRVRSGKVSIIPGYDGEYGKISVMSAADTRRQQSLF